MPKGRVSDEPASPEGPVSDEPASPKPRSGEGGSDHAIAESPDSPIR
jgi:hypothetical protein